MSNRNFFGRGRSTRILATAAIVGASTAASSFGGSHLSDPGFGQLLQHGFQGNIGSDLITGGVAGRGTSDVTQTYVGGGANNLFSTPGNFNNGVPAAGDDITFGPTPAGNYTVNEDTTLQYGNVLVNRATATETVTLQGGINAGSVQVQQGRFVFDGGTSNLNSTTLTNLYAGIGATGNGAITIQNGAVVNAGSALTSSTATSVGSLTVTGAGTKLQQTVLGTTQNTFGGNLGTNTVLVDAGATVNAYRAFMAGNGTFTVSNGSSYIGASALVSGVADSSFATIGNAAGTGTVKLEISGNSNFLLTDLPGAADDTQANFDKFTTITAGLAANSNTTINVLSGSKMTFGYSALGGANNGAPATPTTPSVTSTTTINVDGVGSAINSTYAAQFNGSSVVNFGVNLFGTVNVNVTNGGKVTAPLIALGAGDRNASATTASVTTTVVSGAGSALIARPVGETGFMAFSPGENTTSTTTVSNGGLIDSDTLRVAAAQGSTATLNVNTGGTVNVDYLATSDSYFGDTIDQSTATINVNGGTINILDAGLIELAAATTGGANIATLSISNGGKVNTNDIVTSEAVATRSTINVDGAGSQFNVKQFYQTGGFGSGTAGSGRTVLNVTNGGVVNVGYVNASINTSQAASADAIGTQINVDGANSRFNVLGDTTGGGADGTQPLSAILELVAAGGNRASINVTNGGVVYVEQTEGTPDRSGGVFMSGYNSTRSSITVDGVGSAMYAGTLLNMSISNTEDPILDSQSTVTVRNGGLLDVNGNIQMTPVADEGLIAVLNIGGGAGALDGNSLVDATGGAVLVGGSGASAAPIVGSPATVNLINGTLRSDATLVYAGSNVNITRGTLQANVDGNITARGGNITINAATPVGQARLVADVFEADNGGVIDIGKNGGISLITGVDTNASEVADIKSLIVAGRAGLTNSIKSSVVTSNTGKTAIGYALRTSTINPQTSFLGYTLGASDSAVLFRVTFRGDANLNGTVGFEDLVTLAQNYNGGSGKEWYLGDFDYDSDVDFDDLVSLAQNYSGTYSLDAVTDIGGASFAQDWVLATSLAPEPATLGLVVAAASLLGRRRK